MTTQIKTPRAIAILGLPRNISALVTFATGVVKAMTSNPNFPSPPSLVDLQKAIDDLQVAEAGAATRLRGAAAVRNQKRQALVTLLEGERTYVQAVADGNPEGGPGIIQGSGFALRRTALRPPRTFAARSGAVSGAVKIGVPAVARRAAYDWQYCTDAGKTWIDMPGTLRAKTTLSGLAPQTTVLFRYRALTKTGEGEWSPPISHFVS